MTLLKTIRLDWRSTQENIDSDINAANAILLGKTILDISAGDETVLVLYAAIPSIPQHKIMVSFIRPRSWENTNAALEAALESWVSAQTSVFKLLFLDDGAILAWYA